MQTTEALDLACSFARSQGRDPSRYKTRIIAEGKQWRVEFSSLQDKPRPGDFFTIYLDDESKSVVRLVPGK
jgi:hypothetical protein